MSHTFNLQLGLTDTGALQAALVRCGYTYLGPGTFHLYDSVQTGIGFTMPGMKQGYACVVKEDGTVAMDDYDWTGKLTGVVGTRMNDDRVLHPLMDAYNFEKTRMEAYRQGYSTYECFNEQTKELELHIQIE